MVAWILVLTVLGGFAQGKSTKTDLPKGWHLMDKDKEMVIV
jgi:hypothetical protein